MLFHHAHVVDGHAAVHGLAHVVDGEQGHLHGGEGLHLHARGAHGFHRGGAGNAGGAGVMGAGGGKVQRHAGQCQGVAQGNEVAGLLGSLDACDAGDAQHIPLLGVAGLDERQRGGQHFDAAGGHGDAVGGGFGAYVHHVGLALGVEVGEGAGGGGFWGFGCHGRGLSVHLVATTCETIRGSGASYGAVRRSWRCRHQWRQGDHEC